MKKLLALVLTALASQLAGAATTEEDVAHYVEAVGGPKDVRIKAMDDLAWKGISDARVFDLIEQHLLTELASDSAAERNEIDHEIRALSFSGQAKYMPTLQKVVADSRYSRYGRTATTDLPYYARWNPIISDRSTFNPQYSDDDNRLLNMLHSNDLVLKRLAAKRVYFDIKDQVVLDAMALEIKANFHNKHSGDDADAVAWMVKALGSSGQAQYRPLFQEAAASSPDHEVVSHANRVLEKHYPNP